MSKKIRKPFFYTFGSGLSTAIHQMGPAQMLMIGETLLLAERSKAVSIRITFSSTRSFLYTQ